MQAISEDMRLDIEIQSVENRYTVFLGEIWIGSVQQRRIVSDVPFFDKLVTARICLALVS